MARPPIRLLVPSASPALYDWRRWFRMAAGLKCRSIRLRLRPETVSAAEAGRVLRAPPIGGPRAPPFWGRMFFSGPGIIPPRPDRALTAS
jgi:hypothetical protein